jgi:hypothetical protein
VSVVNESWTMWRDYPYPPARVFAAWADPSIKARWFDPSDEQESTYRGEFRVGGRESASTKPGTSPVAVYEAEYRDIVDGASFPATRSSLTGAGRPSLWPRSRSRRRMQVPTWCMWSRAPISTTWTVRQVGVAGQVPNWTDSQTSCPASVRSFPRRRRPACVRSSSLRT